MQKFVNVLAIASATVSLAVVSGGIYLYTQKDAIIESVTEKALGSLGGGALGGITDSLSTEGLGSAVPVPDMEAPQAAPMESPF
tara:strand:- start:3117 stop:3368 length:252 start_codon:yes stop_codon:yes gene_type:complete